MQWDTYTDTPFDPDVASADNPPDGAVIDYYLKSPPSGDIKLEIFDSTGKLVRTYSSSGDTSLNYKVNVPDFWLAPPPLLPRTAGLHRFVWDLRYPDPLSILYTYYGIHVNYFEYTLADHAIAHNTPWHEPQGPMAVPGRYEIRLTARGETIARPLTVKLDPRLTYSPRELQSQLDLAQDIVANMNATYTAYNQVTEHRDLDKKTESLGDAAGPPPGFGPLNRDLARLLIAVDQSDSPPASELLEVFHGMCQDVQSALSRWTDVLRQAGRQDITVPTAPCR
jgi:hypothetical protein